MLCWGAPLGAVCCRRTVIRKFPNLKFLDSAPVSEREQQLAVGPMKSLSSMSLPPASVALALARRNNADHASAGVAAQPSQLTMAIEALPRYRPSEASASAATVDSSAPLSIAGAAGSRTAHSASHSPGTAFPADSGSGSASSGSAPAAPGQLAAKAARPSPPVEGVLPPGVRGLDQLKEDGPQRSRANFGHTSYKYYGKQSEGNRFIVDNDL